MRVPGLGAFVDAYVCMNSLYLYCFPCCFQALSTDRVRVVLSGVPQVVVHFLLCPFSRSLLFL